MRNEIYLFNPENDMALANFTPYYKAPSEIIRMANDLSAVSYTNLRDQDTLRHNVYRVLI